MVGGSVPKESRALCRPHESCPATELDFSKAAQGEW